MQQKERAHHQADEIIAAKAELETIFTEARKHRETAGESMRKLRSEYAERLHKSTTLQQMAKTMKRRVEGGLDTDVCSTVRRFWPFTQRAHLRPRTLTTHHGPVIWHRSSRQ
eukprot:COSAG02_NODE_1176_length_14061_cov_96.089529_13_plen_112_part_00